MKKTRCGLVPPAPPNADVDKNMAEAKKRFDPRWFKNLMIIIMLIALSFISLQIIVQKTSEIQEYAFVKLSNETSQNLKINFHTYLKTDKALLLKPGKSKVISFIPEYQMISDRNYEILPLVFEANEKGQNSISAFKAAAA